MPKGREIVGASSREGEIFNLGESLRERTAVPTGRSN